MAVDVKLIVAEQCFVTKRGQVRKVINIKDGKVEYKARGSKKFGIMASWFDKI